GLWRSTAAAGPAGMSRQNRGDDAIMELLLITALGLTLLVAIALVLHRPGRAQYRELNKILRKPGRPSPPPHSIFISYRRNDTGDAVGRLYDHLVAAYGNDAVFKDVDAIALGQDFRRALEGALSRCQVFLCVIGSTWEGPLPGGGNAVDRTDDVLRLEIE